MSALQFPALRQLHLVNQRVWTFVACFVQSRRVNTLFECHAAFLMHEGVRAFSDLRVGNSFLLTEAVQTLYHAPTAMPAVTTRDVLNHLQRFEGLVNRDAFRHSSHIELREFSQYLGQQYGQPRIEALGVMIEPAGFGVYIGMLRRIANQEIKELKALENEFNRGIAEKVFKLTQEKFSAENRKQALDDLLSAHQERSAGSQLATNDSQQAGSRRKGGSQASLSLDMLNRVTEVDVYLDNVLRRKAATCAREQQQHPNQQFRSKPISSQAIAETDLKIRNQMTRFLVSSQKSKHHSRLKVVTWVLCGIMAKIHALLLNDDKVPDENVAVDDTSDGDKKDNDAEECDCCCVGKPSCTCKCECECHADSSDEEDGNEVEEGEGGDEEHSANADDEDAKSEKLPASEKLLPPSQAHKNEKDRGTAISLDLKQEVHNFLNSHLSPPNVQSGKDLVGVFAALERHLVQQFGREWSANKTLLQYLGDLVSADANDDSTNPIEWLSLLETASLQGGQAKSGVDFSEDAVLDFVAQCQRTIKSTALSKSLTKERQAKWIEERACIEFGSSLFDGLGVGTLDGVIKQLESGDSTTGGQYADEHSSIVKYYNAIGVSAPVGEVRGVARSVNIESGESVSRHLLARQAVEQVLRSPYLVDVAHFTNWQEQYAPGLGSLLAFIRTHEMMLLDHAATPSLTFVCCLNGKIVRVDEQATASDLELHAKNADVVSTSFVATNLVSQCVMCGGDTNFPTQLVQAHLRSILTATCSRSNRLVTGGKDDSTILHRFALEVITAVPIDFAGFVCSLVQDTVAALLSSSVSTDREVFGDRLWRCCANDSEKQALVVLHERGHVALPAGESMKWSKEQNGRTSVVSTVTNDDMEVDGPTNVTSSPPVASETDAAKNDAVVAYFESGDESIIDKDIHSNTALSMPQRSQAAVTVESTTECHAFIEDLRRQQFGIGLEIRDPATLAVLKIQRQRLERALKRLSDELYSESTHFVLELLQNADDNSYEAGVIPRGEFTLTTTNEIVFFNNESGFSRANIRAICDVGASTKENESGSQSIGKKGIGFKSVFKVSNDPEVHSNGFHIRFHARNAEFGEGMGYILPYWIEDASAWQQDHGTTFVLPLNDSSAQRTSDISASLMAVEPSILLFLRRIREIRLRDPARHTSARFLKTETASTDSTKIVELYSRVQDGQSAEKKAAITQQRWLIVKGQLEVADAFLDGGRASETEVAIALPLLDPSTIDDDGQLTEHPPLQQVFAFLPLRSYGFRFIIQGDFEVPSSREAIINGSEWNQWLISRLPPLIVKSVVVFAEEVQRRHGATDVMAAISTLMALLPLESEVQAPFRGVVGETMRALRASHWLPSGKDATLLRPMDVLDCEGVLRQRESANDSTAGSALCDATLMSTFGKRQLHQQLATAMTPALRTQLRIEQLHASHILRLLALSATKNDLRWTAQMFVLLSRVWDRERRGGLLLQELRLIKCFPLHGSSWTSLADAQDTIYFAPESDSKDSSSKSSEIFTLFGELAILDEEFGALVDEMSEARAFLTKHVGIKTINEHEVIERHLLPEMTAAVKASEAGGPVSVSRVIELAALLAVHGRKCSQCPLHPNIKASMCAVTSTNRLVRIRDEGHLALLLPSISRALSVVEPWLLNRIQDSSSSQPKGGGLDLVSTRYFSSSSATEAEWRRLLVDVCGVSDLLCLDMDDSSSRHMDVVLRWIEEEPIAKLREQVSLQLAKFVDDNWRRDSSKSVDRATVTMWRTHRWLATSSGEFHRSTDLWRSTPATLTLFSATMVPFCAYQWRHDDAASELLGLNETPQIADVMAVLSRLASDSKTTRDLTVDAVAKLYAFLRKELATASSETCEAISAQFASSSLLFITSSDEKCGAWVDVNAVVWSSTTYNGALVALEDLYPKKLRDFFQQVCGVPRKPSIEFLCAQLSSRSAAALDAKKPRRSWEREVSPILEYLSKQLRKGSLAKEDERRIKKVLKTASWIPVVTGTGALTLATGRERPAYALSDADKKTAKLVIAFTESCLAHATEAASASENAAASAVEIVQFGDAETESLRPLLELSRLPSLSADLVVRGSEWVDMLAGFAKGLSANTAGKAHVKYAKLVQRVMGVWAASFAADRDGWFASRGAFRSAVQAALMFPVGPKASRRYLTPIEVYLNDQVDLDERTVAEHASAGDLSGLPVLSLFEWDHFVDAEASGDNGGKANLLQFLTEWCGVRSLQANLRIEVIVVGSQHSASAALLDTLRSSLAIAQRVLFHQHRSRYNQMSHEDLRTLATEIKCVLVEVSGGFEVVYRVGNAFSCRTAYRGDDEHSSDCLLDVESKTMFVTSRSGDEEASSLFAVLMELCRKLFGPTVASSVANVLYLASLQPDARRREQWLVDTQQLPSLPSIESERLWCKIDTISDSGSSSFTSGVGVAGRKRTLTDLEDGEVPDDVCLSSKKQHLATEVVSHSTPAPGPHVLAMTSTPQMDWNAPPPPSSQYLPLPVSYQGFGGPAHQSGVPPPPLPSASPPLQMTPLGNTMTLEERAAVGRWGEEYVYNQLVDAHRDNPELRVTWVNKDDESGLPYDVTVTSASTGAVVEYVEVKSTRTMEKALFEISMNELDQAAVHGSTYSIYRVFNAGDPAQCRVIRMKNPVSLVRQKKIQLALVMQ